MISRILNIAPWKLAGGGFVLGAALVSLTVAAPLWSALRASDARYDATRAAYEQTRVELAAEQKARREAAERIIAEQTRQAELTRERDQARREAAEARGRIVRETVEVIRHVSPEWAASPVPDAVYSERLRGWCARRPERADHHLCGNPPADE